MTEGEARAWVDERFGREAVERLEAFAALVAAESEEQNLIAPSTLATVWARHLVDSAQLLLLASASGAWLDIGTGGGFPGLVVALLRPEPILLVEPRRRRAEFLQRCAAALHLSHVEVRASRIEEIDTQAAIISARAVAPVAKLFADARRCATHDTLWLLPRGRDTVAQIAEAEQHWRGVFHVKQSLTSPESTILVASEVRPR